MRGTLATVAGMLGTDPAACPWHELRYQHVTALQAMLRDRYAPATVNKALSAIRQVLRHAWLLGQVSGEDYDRERAVPNVKGSRLPAGRALDGGELAALFAACAAGSNAGARDAAAFAIRGDVPGPILSPVSKSGRVTPGAPVSAQAIVKRVRVRSGQARIATCSPHDLRRSFVSSALGSGADLAMVQRLAGHASPTTTARYDRRPDEAAREAAQLVHVPFAGG